MYAKHSSNSICMFRAISLSIFLFESFIVAAEFAGGSATPNRVNEEAQNGRGQVPFMLVEGRYALADWGKIPLNPTILGEYSFGTGKRYPVQPGENQESEAGNDQLDVAGRVKRVTKTNIPMPMKCDFCLDSR